jgi:hypothetical protein
MIPAENAVEGTLILFHHDHEWFVKDHLGNIESCATDKYANKFKDKYACVIIDDPEDDAYISGLNGGHLTIVVDKNKIGRPDLLTFENTIEWNSMTHIKAIAKKTNFFCNMALTHYNPYVIKKLELAKQIKKNK